MDIVDNYANASEFQFLTSNKLLTGHEISEIKRMREYLLENLLSYTVNRERVMEFFNNEEKFLKLIEEKRQVLGCTQHNKEIEGEVVFKLKNFLEKYVQEFPTDMELWKVFFYFTKKHKLRGACSKMFDFFLASNGGEPDAWLLVANLEVDMRGSLKDALMWLDKAKICHPGNKEILFMIFKRNVELSVALTKDNDEVGLKEAVKILRRKYDEIKNIRPKDFDLYEKLYYLAKGNTVAKFLEAEIFREIEREFEGVEEAWELKIKANIEMKLQTAITCYPDMIHSEKRKIFKETLEMYKDALKVLNNSVKMWDFFLDFLVKENENNPSYELQRTSLRSEIKVAISKNVLSERHFYNYVMTDVELDRNLRKKTLEKATVAHPHSVRLWHELIRCRCDDRSTDLVIEALDNAKNYIKDLPADEIFPLWFEVIEYMYDETEDRMEYVLKDGIQQKIDLAHKILPIYLSWVHLVYGVAEARKLVNLPEVNNPPCKAFFDELLKIELREMSNGMKNVRNVYEKMLHYFGHEDADLWIDYIKYEASYGNSDQCRSVSERAKVSVRNPQHLKKLNDYIDHYVGGQPIVVVID